MNLAQQVARLTTKVRRLEKREPPLAGVFIDTATDPSDNLRVIVPDWDDGEHAFGPVIWTANDGGVLPTAGDPCVIVEASDGAWWVIAWTTA